MPIQPDENEDVPSWRRGTRKPMSSSNAVEVNNQNKDYDEEDEEVTLRSSSTRVATNEKDQVAKHSPPYFQHLFILCAPYI